MLTLLLVLVSGVPGPPSFQAVENKEGTRGLNASTAGVTLSGAGGLVAWLSLQ